MWLYFVVKETPLLRMLPSAYADGVYQPAHRPANPLTVSTLTMRGSNGNTSRAGKTAFLVFFGQYVRNLFLEFAKIYCKIFDVNRIFRLSVLLYILFKIYSNTSSTLCGSKLPLEYSRVRHTRPAIAAHICI